MGTRYILPPFCDGGANGKLPKVNAYRIYFSRLQGEVSPLNLSYIRDAPHHIVLADGDVIHDERRMSNA